MENVQHAFELASKAILEGSQDVMVLRVAQASSHRNGTERLAGLALSHHTFTAMTAQEIHKPIAQVLGPTLYFDEQAICQGFLNVLTSVSGFLGLMS